MSLTPRKRTACDGAAATSNPWRRLRWPATTAKGAAEQGFVQSLGEHFSPVALSSEASGLIALAISGVPAAA
jgi:hypothetical protein